MGAEALGSKGEPETRNSKLETYSFTVAAYDKSHDLIIDPLLASTFLGGSLYDAGYSIAVDSSNNVFITGGTNAGGTDLPTTGGAYDTTHNGQRDAFVAKFNSTLTTLSAATFLGGDLDYGQSIAVDGSDNVFITGVPILVEQACPRQLAPMTKSTMALGMRMLPNLTTP